MLIQKQRIPFLNILFIGVLPSFLKKIVYKLKGYTIGKKVRIGFGSVLIGDDIEIGDNTKIGALSVVICKKCQLADQTEIGSMVYMNVDKIKIGKHTVIRENNRFGGMDIGKSELLIGSYSHVHQGSFINTTLPVEIGDHTAIGGGSYIFTHSSWQSMLEGYPCTFKPVKIGSNVWISWSVFILPGIEIGDGTLVAAGAVVTKNLPEKCLAQGNPAKVVIPSGMFPREPHPDEKKEKLMGVIRSFIEYLENNDYQVTQTQSKDNVSFDLCNHDGAVIYLHLIYSGNVDRLNEKMNSDSVIIVIDSKQVDIQSFVKNINAPVMDITGRYVTASNSLSKELLKFLKHYGIILKYI